MAPTKSKLKSPKSPARTPAGKPTSNSRNSGSRRSPAGSGRDRSGRPGQGPRLWSILRRHGLDIAGLGAVAAGLLVAGSVWVSIAGPVGEAIDTGGAYAIGFIRGLLPIGLVAGGVMLLRGNRDVDEDQPERLMRVGLGGTAMLVALAGLFHVIDGRPGISDGETALGSAGGALGVVVGGPLHGLAGSWGSVLACSFIGLVGVIVVTSSSARSAAATLVAGIRPLLRWLRRLLGRALGSLFSDLKNQPAGSAGLDPAITPSGPAGPPGSGMTQAHGSAGKETGSGSETGNETSGSAAPAKASQRPLERPEPAPGRGGDAAKQSWQQRSKWKLPPLTMLAGVRSREVDGREVAERARLLQATLAQFGVPTALLEPVVGPTVTRFVLELGEGIKVSKLESLRKDIAYAMASPDVRILAPIPGRRAIGVEVPNLEREIVPLGDILRSTEAGEAVHTLEAAIGRDISGRSMMMNLATMPHLLIAGATGAGKSSCLNSMITSILMRSTPEEVRMILVDPKRVEMGRYDRAPHLLTAPVTDPRQAANALAWAVREMERRYDLLYEVGFRDITGYNAAVAKQAVKAKPGEVGIDGEPPRYRRLPFILVVVDELSDLMMVAARDVEESITRLAQMARAVGIHLVIATQRPSVNVITGVIKANIPARLAFAVSSLTDSRVILDQSGAERLVGCGDMLLLGPSSSAPHRIQGCWVEEAEVRAIVQHWVAQGPVFDDAPKAAGRQPGAPGASDSGSAAPPTTTSRRDRETATRDRGVRAGDALGDSVGAAVGGALADPITAAVTASAAGSNDDDTLLAQAMELVVDIQLGSTSMLQRRLRIGFARAGRIMDLLEQRGVVGPSSGSKAREVLITADELKTRQSS